MAQDPLHRPATPGQINGSSLRQTGPVAKATTHHQPAFGPLWLQDEQGAGQGAKGATDGIQLEDDRSGVAAA